MTERRGKEDRPSGNVSDRVARLRKRSIDAVPRLSGERARIVTRFYRQAPAGLSAPMRRALAFERLMEEKTIHIGDGELIVGERGPEPKATPTYPELCCHSLEDMEILDSREKTSFAVSAGMRRFQEEEVIPFWKGRSMRDLIFDAMTPEWKEAYDAGVFTEFMEQRAPGHTVLDGKIYRRGFNDFLAEIDESRERLDTGVEKDGPARLDQLEAMAVCARALIRFSERHAEEARIQAARESDAARRVELERIAAVCDRVPARAPATFHEALQYYWFVHLGVITELNTWDAFNPGRLDRHLAPFYRKGLADGSLTRESARELLHCFWIKFNNQPAPPKVGVTAAESGTYTDFALINTGGLDGDGADGVNEVSMILLDVIEEMRLLQPSSCVQVSEKNPDSFLKRALKIVRTGFGQPSIFNADVILRELERQGKSRADALSGGASGCVEVGAFGKENYNLTGYLNLPRIFEIALNNGLDPRGGTRIGLETGIAEDFVSFEDLFDAFRRQLLHFVDIKVRGNSRIERLYACEMPAPYLSLMIDDCIAAGRDYHDGGARYNTSYIQCVGLGSLTDALTAVRYHVFDKATLSMGELLTALRDDFAGREGLRRLLVNGTPKYGNDDTYADGVMSRIFEACFETIDGRPNTKGGTYHINLLPTTVHVYFGSVTGALPDGRRAGEPLSEGVSPVQGADRKGPTAVMKSVARIDHVRTGGTLLNQKFTPHLLAGETGLDKVRALVRGYFRLGGHHVQFNVVDAATLRRAQEEPEKSRDLIVRVAGYSDYFCDLSRALQDEIIARTEQGAS
jgi:trans-4-hydroxy-L-proline dehydratase